MRVSQKRCGKQKGKDVVQLDEGKIDDILKDRLKLTKRSVLAFQMGQYDPLGHITPLMLKGKLLMQSLTLQGHKLGWDDPLPESDAADWARYIYLVLNLPDVRIPCSIVVTNGVEPWLVIFTNASSVATGAVAYVRWRIPSWDESEAESRLIMS